MSLVVRDVNYQAVGDTIRKLATLVVCVVNYQVVGDTCGM